MRSTSARPTPGGAAPLIGLVTAPRGSFAFVDGVTYDTEAMLTDLGIRLGADELRRILDGTAGQPLPTPPS